MGFDAVFRDAAGGVVSHLHDVLPLHAWIVAGVDGSTWTPVVARGRGAGGPLGLPQPYADTLCSRLLDGRGPSVGERLAEHAVYAQTPLAQRLRVQAYLGVELRAGQQRVGTVCAVDTRPRPGELAPLLPRVQVMARLLGGLLQARGDVEQATRRALAAEQLAHLDVVTQALSRRGWLERLTAETARCDRDGTGIGLVCLDVNGLKAHNDTHGHAAGDDLLRRVAETVATVLRPTDLLARLGGDEFAVASPGLPHEDVPGLRARVSDALRAAGLSVALGAAWRAPDTPLTAAWTRADARMYAHKRAGRHD